MQWEGREVVSLGLFHFDRAHDGDDKDGEGHEKGDDRDDAGPVFVKDSFEHDLLKVDG